MLLDTTNDVKVALRGGGVAFALQEINAHKHEYALIVAAPLDRELYTEHALMLTAYDGDTLIATRNVTITVWKGRL